MNKNKKLLLYTSITIFITITIFEPYFYSSISKNILLLVMISNFSLMNCLLKQSDLQIFVYLIVVRVFFGSLMKYL